MEQAEGWNPVQPPAAAQTVECATDTRYQIRSEWQLFRGNITRRVYRAFYRGYAIGEIQQSTHREAVMAEVLEFRAAGGFGPAGSGQMDKPEQ